MKIAILSDIHANWQALEAVLRDCPPVDETLCLGDVVGYGGDPKRCVDEVIRRKWLTLVGNHDRACTDPEILEWFNDDAASVVRWTIEVIGEERLEWLRGLPDSHFEHDVLHVHASPRDHIYEYVLDTAVAHANLELLDGGICFHGHTHVPGIFGLANGTVTHEYRVDSFRLTGPALVNPGSVGLPFNSWPPNGALRMSPWAEYAILTVEDGCISTELRRAPYDVSALLDTARKGGMPHQDWWGEQWLVPART